VLINSYLKNMNKDILPCIIMSSSMHVKGSCWNFVINLFFKFFFFLNGKETRTFPGYLGSQGQTNPRRPRPIQLRVPLCGRPMIWISSHTLHGVRTRVVRDTIQWPLRIFGYIYMHHIGLQLMWRKKALLFVN